MRTHVSILAATLSLGSCAPQSPPPQAPCHCPAVAPPPPAPTAAAGEPARPSRKLPDTFAGFRFDQGLGEAEAACPGKLEVAEQDEGKVEATCYDSDSPAPFSRKVRLSFAPSQPGIQRLTVDVPSVEQGLKVLVRDHGPPDSVAFCSDPEGTQDCSWSNTPAAEPAWTTEFTWVFDAGMIRLNQDADRQTVLVSFTNGQGAPAPAAQ